MLELIPISLTGFDKLLEEVSQLEKEAAETRQRVREAREQGDLKENGEYIYGREQLGFIEGRLGQLRTAINQSEKIDCTKVNCDSAEFGTVVTLLNIDTDEKVTYQLLGPHDANFKTGSISILSPVGKALHGLKIGDKTSVTIPRGEFNFELLEINKSEIQ
ncbi:MAG: transcription elongation factor GreA [Sedimentisphaerales bacterium]|nr:transcription elongation factor GreA [Sedimentisphaerales bacterium]